MDRAAVDRKESAKFETEGTEFAFAVVGEATCERSTSSRSMGSGEHQGMNNLDEPRLPNASRCSKPARKDDGDIYRVH